MSERNDATNGEATPRTDALAKRLTGGVGYGLLWEHARRLEQELDAMAAGYRAVMDKHPAQLSETATNTSRERLGDPRSPAESCQEGVEAGATREPHGVGFDKWLSYQPWSEAVPGTRVYFDGTVRAAWYAGASARSAIAPYTQVSDMLRDALRYAGLRDRLAIEDVERAFDDCPMGSTNIDPEESKKTDETIDKIMEAYRG